MARGHPGLPPRSNTVLSKADLLSALAEIDQDEAARDRILTLDTGFKRRIRAGIEALPTSQGRFQDFKTSPYVLLIHTLKNGYSEVAQLEADIVPAKAFSSMETSAGKMTEEVALPVYGWQVAVPSQMHSSNSAIDGTQLAGDVLRVATLKSGPQCLNDEMAENFADAILAHLPAWAGDAGVDRVEFTYGVLYGTRRQSNKKDWHILRNIDEKLHRFGGEMIDSPRGRWDCRFELEGIEATVSVRIGVDWWEYLGGQTCPLELWVALIRACVAPDPGYDAHAARLYAMSDLDGILSVAGVPPDYNVSILQGSQIPWFFFIARHFCDDLVP